MEDLVLLLGESRGGDYGGAHWEERKNWSTIPGFRSMRLRRSHGSFTPISLLILKVRKGRGNLPHGKRIRRKRA